MCFFTFRWVFIKDCLKGKSDVSFMASPSGNKCYHRVLLLLCPRIWNVRYRFPRSRHFDLVQPLSVQLKHNKPVSWLHALLGPQYRNKTRMAKWRGSFRYEASAHSFLFGTFWMYCRARLHSSTPPGPLTVSIWLIFLQWYSANKIHHTVCHLAETLPGSVGIKPWNGFQCRTKIWRLESFCWLCVKNIHQGWWTVLWGSFNSCKFFLAC